VRAVLQLHARHPLASLQRLFVSLSVYLLLFMFIGWEQPLGQIQINFFE